MKRCAFVVLGILSAGCNFDVADSTDVNPDQLYQSYTISYSETSKSLCGRAQFTISNAAGKSVDLQKPASVTFDGSPMAQEAFLGISYHACTSGTASGNHSFIFRTNDGSVYTNSVNMISMAIQNLPHTVSRTGFTVSFVGNEVETTDSIEVSASGTAGRDAPAGWTSYSNTVRVTANGSTLRVPPTVFQMIQNGTVRIAFKRARKPRIQQSASVGGDLTVEYDSPSYSVQLTD